MQCFPVCKEGHTTTPLQVSNIATHVFQFRSTLQVLVSRLGVGVSLKMVNTPEFKSYQMQTVANSRTMCKALQERGYTIVSGT